MARNAVQLNTSRLQQHTNWYWYSKYYSVYSKVYHKRSWCVDLNEATEWFFQWNKNCYNKRQPRYKQNWCAEIQKINIEECSNFVKILASLQKYYLMNADFVVSLFEISTKLFRANLDSKIMFVALEQVFAKLKSADSYESTAHKPKYKIFQDVIENLVAIITAGYSVYLLSCSSEMITQIKLLNQEEIKQPNTASGGEKREATNSNFDPLCTDYFRGIDLLVGAKI